MSDIKDDVSGKILQFRDYFMDKRAGAMVEDCNSILEEMDNCLPITRDEVKTLYEYFFRDAGYIPYENEPLNKVIKRIQEFVDGKKEFKPVRKV